MTYSSWLDELPALGRLPADEAAAKLREVGEDELADALKAVPGKAPAGYRLADLRLRRDRVFRHTGQAIGYLAPSPGPRSSPLAIHHVGNIAPDPSLKDARITLTLDALRVADYPGRGPHRVLFDFAAGNHLADRNGGDLHFNTTYRVAEGEHAAVLGRPVFVGLQVGDRVLLQCATVNVHNEDDEAFLQFLEADLFKAGLQLATTWQPALAPLSAMVVALTKAIATRHRNVVVQAVELGLDFRIGLTGARLAEGAYVVVQIPESAARVAWRWRDWVYDPTSGHIVSTDNPTQLLPYNYFVIGISRYQGP